jgi:hypothetical protein
MSLPSTCDTLTPGSANRALAGELAERSAILLDAGSALPLRPELRKVAVVGPCAAEPRTFMGCYAFPNHVLPRYPGLGLGVEARSAVDALRAELPDVEVTHVQGCQVLGDDRSGFPAALAAARDADLCVAFVGDLAGLFGRGSSGEGCDAPDLRLPGRRRGLDAPRPATAPTSVFAGNDETAAGVVEAARARGMRVPEDLSVVGFDDTYVARLASPPLTTVRQPLREMGGVALRTAIRLAAGEKLDSHHVELATELVVRGSTGPPPGDRTAP